MGRIGARDAIASKIEEFANQWKKQWKLDNLQKYKILDMQIQKCIENVGLWSSV